MHPWLMSMRDDIIGALATEHPGYPSSSVWKLSTGYDDFPQLRIDNPDNWDSQNWPPHPLQWTSRLLPTGHLTLLFRSIDPR